MTYKAAASGLNLGGGKSMIIGDPHTDKFKVLSSVRSDATSKLWAAAI
jgi:glutamate dehydrogenase/leucine dehydrogenase